ncbi:MAG TPA: vitamin K epoxide reductase family protein [Thermoanaerobaculia bacterium]|nr:vitamin K epoxide reductase family protein [Thermoanaerobaculia bacterium]
MARKRAEARPITRPRDPAIQPAGTHDHAEMLRRWMWRDFANITLGLWLLASPATLGYRSVAMVWSDVISGALIVVLGVLTLFPRCDLARWGLCFVGLWLLIAPLVFWTPDPGAYATDMLIGALVIAFSVLIPMMPSRAHHQVMMTPGPDTPPGWSYNPSDWIQRGPIIALAFVGFFLSRYLAAYQLGHIAYPWDPFFVDGTRRVLDSEVSQAWPISDAGLGAASYMIEALSGFMGGRNRWRTMPWMVVMFGVLVVPVGIVSIVLVMLQPIAVGAWCTLCLITAAAMLIMISPAIDEVVAMSQFLLGARREGKPFWRTFWVGGTLDAYEHARPAQSRATAHWHERSIAARIVAAMDLNLVPWNLLLSAALGVWLMAAPAELGTTGAAADGDYLAGALVVTWAVIAFGEIVRPIRLLNVLMGLGILAAPWMLTGDTEMSRWNDVIVGIALIALSIPRGRIEERFGGWNRYLSW